MLAILIIALVKCVEGSSVCLEPSSPYTKLPHGWSRLSIFPESHCHTSLWGDHDHILPDCFLNRPHLEWTLTVPLLIWPNNFRQLKYSWQARGPRAPPLLDLHGAWRNVQSKASPQILSPLQCGAGLNQPNSCALITFPLHFAGLKFCSFP